MVICVPGLTGNMKHFDFLGARLSSEARQVVSLDLRGRGMSDPTPAGSYGWESHARDVLAVADSLGAPRFSLIGESMGGCVAMEVAALGPGRVERLVLIDVCGAPDADTLKLIPVLAARLAERYPSAEAYLDRVRGLGTIDPWSDYWERAYRYELVEVVDGVRARSDPDAVMEDARYGVEQDVYKLWPRLTMPVLLLRATREIRPGNGYVVTAECRDRFQREVPTSTVVEVDTNHFMLGHSAVSLAAIREFFGREQ
jgi:pimeloyl-ACP methyl ester carboxylesterase